MKNLAFAIAIVLILTLLLELAHFRLATYLLFAGSAFDLLIEGGHGGTHAERLIGALLGLLLNVAVYWSLISFVCLLRRRVADSPPNTR